MKPGCEEPFIKSMPSDESLLRAWERDMMEDERRDRVQVNFIFYLLVAIGGLMAVIGVIWTVTWIGGKLALFLSALSGLT